LGGIAARRRLAAAETIDTDRWRDPNETLRTATPLKLLHDLAFVVAFAAAAEQLGMERSGRARPARGCREVLAPGSGSLASSGGGRRKVPGSVPVSELGVREGLALRGQTRTKLFARADAELGEHLAEMPLDGARTEEELRADLRVRQAISGEPGDLLFL
jgi:hypothetical protein